MGMNAPVYTSEVDCTLAGGDTITKSGTPAQGCMTFDQATGFVGIPLTTGDEKHIAIFDQATPAWAFWRAVWNGTTWTRVGPVLQEGGTLAASGLVVSVVNLGDALSQKYSALVSGNHSATVGANDVLDISGATGPITWTLPDKANLNDLVSVALSTDAPNVLNRELDIHTASAASKIDGIGNYDSGSEPYTSLLMAGETLTFRCVSATNPDWRLEKDGRKKCNTEIRLGLVGQTVAVNIAHQIHFDVAVHQRGYIVNLGVINVSPSGIVVRRKGIVDIAVTVTVVATAEGKAVWAAFDKGASTSGLRWLANTSGAQADQGSGLYTSYPVQRGDILRGIAYHSSDTSDTLRPTGAGGDAYNWMCAEESF